MKLRKRMLCLLLLACVLVSCGKTPAEHITRDEFLLNREQVSHTVSETVGDVQFEVVFDRREYVLGDDVNFTVTVTYHGDDPLAIERTGLHIIDELIDGNAYIGDVRVAYLMEQNILRIDTTQTYELISSTVLARIGRFCSAEFADLISDKVPVMLCFSLNEDIQCHISVPFSSSLPQDEKLYTALSDGRIDEALYYRAMVMDEQERIAVFAAEPNPPSLEIYLSDVSDVPVWQEEFGVWFVSMTREQLLTVLSGDYPISMQYSMQEYGDLVNYMNGGQVNEK